jgi:hypothetical protein
MRNNTIVAIRIMNDNKIGGIETIDRKDHQVQCTVLEHNIRIQSKGMDACASSYIMYGNVNKRLPVFAIRHGS